jgi:hypothetical protein
MSKAYGIHYNLNYWDGTKLFYFITANNGQVKYPRCCTNEPEYLITYDCGPDPEEIILVCKEHFKEEPFQRFAIKIEKLRG